ncbi:hypothetical protein ACWCQS_12210 [Streptomyces sp. NPDC002076]
MLRLVEQDRAQLVEVLPRRPYEVVDDGPATGSTARAALRRVRHHSPERVAVPVRTPQAAGLLREEAGELVRVHRPGTFMAVGQW